MPIDYNKIKNWPFPDIEQTYTAKDSILYVLGVGYGQGRDVVVLNNCVATIKD